jgi:hypothetical protein
MKIHTLNSLKNEGIGIVEMRKMAAQAWQDFQNDVANEENTKPVKVTAKTAKHYDFAGFAIFENNELSEIVYVVVEDAFGDYSVELAHVVFPEWEM